MKSFISFLLAATLMVLVSSQSSLAQGEMPPDWANQFSAFVRGQDTYLAMSGITPTRVGGAMNILSLGEAGSNAYDAYVGGTREHYWALVSDTVNRGLHIFVLPEIAGASGVIVGGGSSILVTPAGGAIVGAGVTTSVYLFGTHLINQVFPSYQDYLQMAAEESREEAYSSSYFEYLEQQRLEDTMALLAWNFPPSTPVPPPDPEALTLKDVEGMLDEPAPNPGDLNVGPSSAPVPAPMNQGEEAGNKTPDDKGDIDDPYVAKMFLAIAEIDNPESRWTPWFTHSKRTAEDIQRLRETVKEIKWTEDQEQVYKGAAQKIMRNISEFEDGILQNIGNNEKMQAAVTKMSAAQTRAMKDAITLARSMF